MRISINVLVLTVEKYLIQIHFMLINHISHMSYLIQLGRRIHT